MSISGIGSVGMSLPAAGSGFTRSGLGAGTSGSAGTRTPSGMSTWRNGSVWLACPSRLPSKTPATGGVLSAGGLVKPACSGVILGSINGVCALSALGVQRSFANG
ncbi:hypothetical protein L3Q67_36175 [Saccharothrix sp. AJ9571]|nr:hypothetical protein L3Q67_36175 [Saccharothrix sp. AJ9571]